LKAARFESGPAHACAASEAMVGTKGFYSSECESRWAQTPEYDLVRLAQSGSHSAFEELTRRNSDPCFRVAASILRSREDARDEVQNALWLAYSRIELFNFQARFSSWLIRIVINSCYMRLPKIQRTPILNKKAGDENKGWNCGDGVTSDTPELDLGREQVWRALKRELSNIPQLLRIPIELHYMKELPLKEVARELGVTVAAAKSRLHRGHLFLRDRMLKHTTQRGPASLTAN
jgi:RNA polymerase sigma-70 factor (ECF subfamily)